VFCGGCLVVEVPGYRDEPEVAARLAGDPAFTGWPLIVLTDDAKRATRSAINFLWTTFTRFEPAADISAASQRIVRNHVSYQGPVVIDARMKPWYPAELFCADDTASLVSSRWSEYFPQGRVEMGDSARGHLD
jgi:hypothetical protein